jgi:LacI family transcriptional regulator
MTAMQRTEQQTGQQPDSDRAAQRALLRPFTRAIALIVPESSNPFFLEVAEGLQAAVEEEGTALMICHTHGSPKREQAFLSMLVDIPIAGVAIIPAAETQPALRTLIDHRIPVVVIDRDLPGLPVDCLFSDHVAGAVQAVSHLIDLGHSRIACINGPAASFPAQARLAGYHEALRTAAIRPDPLLLRHGAFSVDMGRAATRALLELPSPPTAVFACSDLIAFGVLAAARDVGLALPESLSVVGFDDIRLSALTAPPLTTVHQRREEIGRQAARMLLARMQEPSLPYRRLLLATSLNVRGSTMALHG